MGEKTKFSRRNIIKHNKVRERYAKNALSLIEDDNIFLKQVLKEEIARQLHAAISLLPQRKRQIIQLSLKGVRNTEIAELLGIKLQTVKTLKSQSYKILRKRFKGTIIYFLLT